MLNEPARARTREVEPIWVQSWQPSVGTWARVIGWGDNDDDCTTGFGIKRTALYRIDEVDSHSIYFYQGSGNVHYCGGDSGGPVIDPTSGRVVGVSSYGWFTTGIFRRIAKTLLQPRRRSFRGLLPRPVGTTRATRIYGISVRTRSASVSAFCPTRREGRSNARRAGPAVIAGARRARSAYPLAHRASDGRVGAS